MRLSVFLFILFLSIFELTAKEHDAEIVKYNTAISIKNGKLTRNLLYEIKINNRAGEYFTEIAIPYSKLSAVSNIEAYIRDAAGNIVKKISNKDIHSRSAISDFSFYEDDFVKEFTLKHNFYPYTIVYSYQEKQDEFLYIEHWHPVIDADVPTLNATLTLEVPANYPLFIKSDQTDSYQKDSSENLITHKWTASYKDLLEPEVFAPPLRTFFPSVVVVPESFRFELPGSFSDWTAYGNWQHRLNSGLLNLPPFTVNRIKNLVKDITDNKEKIKVLYQALQNDTRYINITIETGGMKPYPASYVAVNKYGDCKALTNYFKAVLQTIGISSVYAKVYADEVIDKTDKTFPSQQFNHVILCVPLEGDTIWLDCTSKLSFGYLGTFTQNRDAFLVELDNSHFVKTPALLPTDVLTTRTATFKTDENNKAMASFSNTYRGESFEQIINISKFLNQQRQSQAIVKNFIEPGFEVLQITPAESHRDSLFARLNYSASSVNTYRNYGHETLIKILPFDLPLLENPEKRNLPVQINYPIWKTDTLEYALPDGSALVKIPEQYQIESIFGDYKIEFESFPDKVIVHKSVLVKAGNYPLDQYPAFYEFIKTIKDYEKQLYIITQILQ